MTLMHDFSMIAHFNPDCQGVHLVSQPSPTESHYRVEDALGFIPKRLWSGGVSYTATFVTSDDGCDITIKAPGGFTSINRWRLEHGAARLGADGAAIVVDGAEDDGRRVEEEVVVRITSDASCSSLFAGFVKRYLGNSHVQLQRGFREQVLQKVDRNKGAQDNAPAGKVDA